MVIFIYGLEQAHTTKMMMRAKDISLFGVMYKPLDNISFKFELGESGDDDVMRMGLGYMF